MCTLYHKLFSRREESETVYRDGAQSLGPVNTTLAAPAGGHFIASKLGLILVAPDTSPRGDAIPDDSDSGWDFGLGAGFYVDATEAPWNQHYNMYSYVIQELPDEVDNTFPTNGKVSISGHSMGARRTYLRPQKH